MDRSYVHCILVYRGCMLLKNSFVNISEVNRQCLHSLGTRSEDDFEKVSSTSPDPISSLTELLSTHPRNWFLSNPHSLLNCARRAQRQLLAWFQPPQTVSRPSRPNLDSSQNCWCFKQYSTRCHYQSLVRSKKTPPL